MGILAIEGGIEALAHLDEARWIHELLFIFNGIRYVELEQAIEKLQKIKRLIDMNKNTLNQAKTFTDFVKQNLVGLHE